MQNNMVVMAYGKINEKFKFRGKDEVGNRKKEKNSSKWGSMPYNRIFLGLKQDSWRLFLLIRMNIGWIRIRHFFSILWIKIVEKVQLLKYFEPDPTREKPDAITNLYNDFFIRKEKWTWEGSSTFHLLSLIHSLARVRDKVDNNRQICGSSEVGSGTALHKYGYMQYLLGDLSAITTNINRMFLVV